MGPILIDCDDVCVNLLDAWLNEINKVYGLNYNPEDIQDWNISKFIKEISENQVYQIIHQKEMYKNMEPIRDAVKYLKLLKDKDYDLRIVTAHAYGNSLIYKMDRFFELFPFISWEEVIVAHDKSLLHGSFMIDDKPDNLLYNQFIGEKILFKRHHNTGYHNLYNFFDFITDDWKEIYEIIVKGD